MKMTTGFALILVGLALNACSFSSSDGNQEEQARLESDYHLSESEIAPLKGLWTGTLTRAADGAVVPINVSISSQPLTTGYTASGRAVQRALPTATLVSMKDTTYSASFQGSYSTGSGTLVLTNSNPAKVGADDLQSLTLVFNGHQLTGNLESHYQHLGTVSLTLSATSRAGLPAIDEQTRENQVLRESYNRFVGSYFGTVDDNSSLNGKPFNVCLKFYISTDATPSTSAAVDMTSRTPVLMAVYTRYDAIVGSGVDTRTLRGKLYDEEGSLVLNTDGVVQPFSGTGAGTGAISYRVALDFRLPPVNARNQFPELDGTQETTAVGAFGKISLKRVDVCPARQGATLLDANAHSAVPPLDGAPVAVTSKHKSHRSNPSSSMTN